MDGWIESVQTGIAYAVARDGQGVQVSANVCMHGGGRITWCPDRQAFIWPCHSGAFGVDGAGSAGPAGWPLEKFPCRIAGGQVHKLLEV